MRLVVRFLPGSLLLCAAVVGVALLWDGDDAHADAPHPASDNTLARTTELADAAPALALPVHTGDDRVSPPDVVPALLFASPPPATPTPIILSPPPPPSADSATVVTLRDEPVGPGLEGLDEVTSAAAGLLTPARPDIPSVDAVAAAAPLLGSVLPAPHAPDPPTPAPPASIVAVAPAAMPDAPSFAASPDLAFSSAPSDATDSSRSVAGEAGGDPLQVAGAEGAARAPPVQPVQLPVPPCPDGGVTNANGTDLAGVAPTCADDGARRARLHAGAHSYSSNSLLDPLLRPD